MSAQRSVSACFSEATFWCWFFEGKPEERHHSGQFGLPQRDTPQCKSTFGQANKGLASLRKRGNDSFQHFVCFAHFEKPKVFNTHTHEKGELFLSKVPWETKAKPPNSAAKPPNSAAVPLKIQAPPCTMRGFPCHFTPNPSQKPGALKNRPAHVPSDLFHILGSTCKNGLFQTSFTYKERPSCEL